MAKKTKKKPAAVEVDEEDADIAETRKSLASLVKNGVTPHRLASIAGAHPDDMRGFLDGRVSLTWQLRKRLRDALPDLLSPKAYGPEG